MGYIAKDCDDNLNVLTCQVDASNHVVTYKVMPAFCLKPGFPSVLKHWYFRFLFCILPV